MSGKALGLDCIPADIYKHGDKALQEKLNNLFQSILEKARVQQDFKDAFLVHIYTRERWIKHPVTTIIECPFSALWEEVLAHVILNRLTDHVADSVIPESQCGFLAGRSSSGMVFAVWQLQEKCHEQNSEIHMLF